MNRITVTTSIAYINAEPHIGFLFELIAADALARYRRQNGDEVFFLTGTDEHGTKIEQAARAAGEDPQAYADRVAASFRQLSADFSISNDYFVRTTTPQHVEFVQKAWQRIYETGVITKKEYRGSYCTGCEAFKTEREIVNGRCSVHERPVETVSEENYYLAISPEIKERIRAWIGAITPTHKQSEVLNQLEEFDGVSVSRPKEKLSWGIPVPGDDTQVMYVWVDALLNYLSGIEASGRKIDEYWPGVQLIGKDILKFHAIIWPALLIALDKPLPKQLLVHGFITVDGKKMSKSLGNVVTPGQLHKRYGAEATRYLLLRQLNFFEDSNFVWSELDALYTGELANGLGNLVNRVVGLCRRFGLKKDEQVRQLSEVVEFDVAQQLKKINELVNDADKFVTEHALWVDLEKKQHLLREVVSDIFIIAHILEPFLPQTALEIRRQLRELDPKPLFPRLNQ